MGYYDYWKSYYTTETTKVEDLYDLSSVIEYIQKQGYQSYNVTLDGIFEKEMLIYEHIDPIEGKAIDMRAICLDTDNIHWGNVIELEDGRSFMAITRNDWNGAYNKYKVRELKDDISFNQSNMKCIVADKGMYDETSFVNDTNVFNDKELKAAIIQFNDDTSKLTLFDNVSINGENYQIVKIDNETYKEYNENYGVLQLVVVMTPMGDIRKGNELLRGCVITARVKDKILNSISRTVLCEHNKLSKGDYVDFTYDRDKKGTMTTETYLVINRPTMCEGYDTSLMYFCECSTNLINDIGEVVNIPLFYEDNRTRVDKTIENQYIELNNSSYLVKAQNNPVTRKLISEVKRIMINGRVYSITDCDSITCEENEVGEIISIGLEIDQIDDVDDNLELGVANYYSQMKQHNTPTGDIVGSDTLYLNYESEYTLNTPNSCIWSVSDSGVKVVDLGGNKCEILCASTSMVNKTFELYATVGSYVYKKTITIKMIGG